MWRSQGLPILNLVKFGRRAGILRCSLDIRLQASRLLLLCHKLCNFLGNAQSLYGPDYVARQMHKWILVWLGYLRNNCRKFCDSRRDFDRVDVSLAW